MISGALAAVLAANRERLNARVAAARMSGRGVDAKELGELLQTAVAPAVDALNASDAAAAERAALALIELTIDLLAADVIGANARVPAIVPAWQRILPLTRRLLRYDARRVAGAMTNALTNIATFAPAAATRWIESVADVASDLEALDDLLRAGRVAAWRAGLAHLRESALNDCAALPPNVAERLLATNDPVAALAQLRADPWSGGTSAASPAARLIGGVGAFRGFGGAFIKPPLVANVDDHVVVASGDSLWTLYADRFGATVLPNRTAELKSRFRAATSSVSAFPQLVEPTSVAVARGTTAVTVRYSHTVYIIGRY